MRSSRAAVDLIVSHEVTSRPVYEKKYIHPEWPGVQSGLTVGVGYDLGYNTAADIHNDWSPYLSAAVVSSMQKYAGIHGGISYSRDRKYPCRGMRRWLCS